MKSLEAALIAAILFALGGCFQTRYFGIGASSGSVWYDGYYGPYYGGYWQSGTFFYSDRHGNYVRDGAGHFRHDRFDGGRRYRADRPPRSR